MSDDTEAQAIAARLSPAQRAFLRDAPAHGLDWQPVRLRGVATTGAALCRKRLLSRSRKLWTWRLSTLGERVRAALTTEPNA